MLIACAEIARSTPATAAGSGVFGRAQLGGAGAAGGDDAGASAVGVRDHRGDGLSRRAAGDALAGDIGCRRYFGVVPAPSTWSEAYSSKTEDIGSHSTVSITDFCVVTPRALCVFSAFRDYWNGSDGI
ncbi:hypothetical protein ABZ747_17800 [Kitasatospora cineracea]|uniref:hypothetical protein n=1 Tax=Kitasatospora cineracea TaxID=88074 RepID=UPI0033F092D4